MDQIADFRGFFDRCGQFEQERYEESVTSFGRVRSKLPSLLEDVRQEEMSFAPRFNIFRALDIERKEDDLHTPMLAHLLDPSAQHSQGNVFLKHFFETIRRHRPDVPEANLLEGGHWTIQREFYIGGGTVDLLIENAGRRYVVVVENKIDTDDHDDQIPRYYKWLMTHRRDYKWQLLIYLTPEGRRPLSCTDCQYLRLSYMKDIVGFLTAALQEVKARPVLEVVQQYLAILNCWAEDEDDKTS